MSPGEAMADRAFAFVPRQGTGIYRPSRCHAKAGETSLTLHGCGRQHAVEQEENNLPAPPLLIPELLLLQPKPGSPSAPVPLQLGMEQAASLGAVLGAAPALHKSPREKCGFHVLIHPLAQR